MEVTIKLSEENVTAIAEKMVEIQNKNKPTDTTQPTEFSKYTVNEVAKMSKKQPQAIRYHIQQGLLIAEKVGKSWLISQTNFNKYINNEQ